MGMFDKDKEIGNEISDAFGLREPFVLWAASIADETVTTVHGDARKSILVCSSLAEQSVKLEYTTLASAIADKVEEQEDGDLPAIVELRKVESKRAAGGTALVLQFVRPLSTDPFDGLETTPEPAEKATAARKR